MPDGPPTDVPLVPCESPTTSTCSGDTLLKCTTVGELPTPRNCPWGCSDNGGDARCLEIAPAGGAVTSTDLDPMTLGALGDVTLEADTIINSDGSSIMGPIDPVTVGFTFTASTSDPLTGIYHFKSLTISGALTLRGAQSIALVADGPITIDGIVDTQACIAGNAVTLAGPGGGAGGERAASALGNGAGQTTPPTSAPTEGAGGGGFGGVGGLGGNGGGAGGGAFEATPLLLVGGGGGGGGPGATSGGLGGAGGAAIQLVSNTSITINTSGGINAGGCGGANSGGGGNDGGGGGGAGGLILLEAPQITISGSLAVNGGGGGGGRGTVFGVNGTLTRTPAAGGVPGGSGGAGGLGAAADGVGANKVDGLPGGTGDRSGAGGGGIGRMRFNTRGGTATVDNTKLSPALNDTPTTTFEGTATTQ